MLFAEIGKITDNYLESLYLCHLNRSGNVSETSKRIFPVSRCSPEAWVVETDRSQPLRGPETRPRQTPRRPGYAGIHDQPKMLGVPTKLWIVHDFIDFI